MQKVQYPSRVKSSQSQTTLEVTEALLAEVDAYRPTLSFFPFTSKTHLINSIGLPSRAAMSASTSFIPVAVRTINHLCLCQLDDGLGIKILGWKCWWIAPVEDKHGCSHEQRIKDIDWPLDG